MERRNLAQFEVATETWKKQGFVELELLRSVAETLEMAGSFSSVLDRLVLAFNGSARSRSAIDSASQSDDPRIIALKQQLIDLGAWSSPYSQISASTYRRSKGLIADEAGFNAFTTNAKIYPYYQPGLTIGYDVAWIRSTLNAAKTRFTEFKEHRTSDTAILVGNGPSLNKVDFDLFNGRDVFLSNYAIKHPDLRAAAKGVAVTNYLVAEQEPYLFGLDPGVWKFFPFWLRHTIHPDDKTIFLNAEGGELFFSRDVVDRVAWHSTVSYFWLQILYSAGYDRVLMTGFDNSYKQSATAKEGDLVDQKDDDPNHFDPTYFKGKQWQAADTGKMEDTYVLSKKNFEESGRELVNCTVGGALEVLRRAPLSDELSRAKPINVCQSPRIALVTAFWQGDANAAERHWRASQRFAPVGMDHIHIFKHGPEKLPKVTMERVFCADIDRRYPEASSKPHPAGPNLTFVHAVKLLKQLGYTHFFWFEPDCVPTQSGWFEPFLKAISEYPKEPIIGVGGGTVIPNKPHWKNHFAGCSVYNVEALVSLDWQRFVDKELSVSFDVWLSRELGFIRLGDVNNTDQTDTIIFGADRYDWKVLRNPKSITVGMFEHWRPEKFLSKAQLRDRLGWKQFSLFHAIKDPELLELSAMRKRPKAAIVIINYNNEKFIQKAIESAIDCRENYENIDIVVVDDGSSDRSRKIIANFGQNIHAIFLEHGLNVPNLNQQRAVKAALRQTDAELIYLMDGDDFFTPDKVAGSVDYFDDLDVILVQHALHLVDEDGHRMEGVCAYFPKERVTPELFAEHKRSNFFQPTSGLIVRRSYLEKSMSWTIADQHHDTWLDVRVTRLAPFYGKVVSTQKILGSWRRHAASDSIRTDNVEERVARHHSWFEAETQRQKIDINLNRTKFLNEKTLFVSGFARSDRAEVDETDVVAYLLRDRKGSSHTMIDVGAHVGTSAHFFDRLGWSINCFEPDPSNRSKLVSRFGENERVRIDCRAVSDEPASQVKFFTSDQSTGISGLHSFHESHNETGLVDITTLRDVFKERKISKVDFLKIDVEGFDLSVLRGVPWDDVRPDVIECEFEDAKTIKLGHDWKVIADYLKDKGYAVYVSEWNPIVRYGIPHDWRRVFPYGFSEMPADAWGNLLAFREDPGIDVVVAAFRAKVKYRKEQNKRESVEASAATVESNPSKFAGTNKQTESGSNKSKVNESNLEMLKQTPGYEPLKLTNNHEKSEPVSPGNAWYSTFAHKLRARSPAAFDFLRFIRRSMTHFIRRPFTLVFLLSVAGFLGWSIWQNPVSSAVMVWWISISVILGGLMLYVAHRAHYHAEQLHLKSRALERQIMLLEEHRTDAPERRSAAIDGRLAKISDELSTLNSGITNQDSRIAGIESDLVSLLKQIEQHAADAVDRSASLAELSNTVSLVQTGIATAIEELEQKASDHADSISSEIAGKQKSILEQIASSAQDAREKNDLNARVIEALDLKVSEQVAVFSNELESLGLNSTEQFAEFADKVSQLALKTETVVTQVEQISMLKDDVGILKAQTQASDEKLNTAESRLNSVEKWSAKDNSTWYQHFNRQLRQDHVEVLQNEWRKRLSLPTSPHILGYMATRICLLEKQMDGRLATTVEDMLLRILVAQSIKSKSINVLEIGTLFGTGAAAIYDAIVPQFEDLHLTLLDPLEGYYNGAQADILTGKTVNQQTLERNFARVGIPKSDYSLIKQLSTDLEAIESAGKNEYDLLIIDGDHSYAGVKTDFENYAQFVKLGGYIIFDDYNSPDWPEVKQYVDEEMSNHKFVSFVGSSWRTCVYRVVKPPKKSGSSTVTRSRRTKKTTPSKPAVSDE